ILDRAYHHNDFSNADKKKLRHLLGELSHELVVSHGQVELTDLYNRYAAGEQVLLIDTVMQDAEADVRFAKKIPKDHAQPDKKTAKQQQEQEKISKSIQSVYRQLVASLHPDREPDEQERERKTKLMQKVNVAYGKKDLLQLLELQLAVEQIDQAHLNNLSEDRLKHFNKVLQEQFTELSEEVEDIESAFKRQMNLAAKVHLSPKYLMKNLDEAMKDLQRSIKGLQMNNKAAKDSAVLKSWLKSYQIPKDALF
ncbi:MAG: hypothetical protein Q8Q54_01305, partial [Methylococcales bacterium]|nr:hypothetical protein [Methylococcales bacterium]